MKTIKPPILQFHLILLLIIACAGTPVHSQPVGIQANLSATELVSGEDVTLTFLTDAPSDIYFFSAEIAFDPDQLEFKSAAAAGAMLPDGQIVFSPNAPGVYGISATRTEPLSGPVADDLIQLTFTVKQYSAAGEGEISYSNINFADSEGHDIVFTEPAEAEYNVEKTIADLRLTSPASITVTEGDSFEATGEIFATGITADDENTDTLNVWIGVSETNTDPSTWSVDVWEPMSFVEQTDADYFTYSYDIAYQRPINTYYIALKGEIVNSGVVLYGGIGGFWEENDNPSATLEIEQQGQYQYKVAEWTFEDDVYTPKRATFPNQQSVLELVGASMNGFTSGAANSNGWDSDTEDDNYWQIRVNTVGLKNLKLSSDQGGGSSTGPKDFKVQYSTGGSTWTDLIGGVVEVGSGTQEIIDQLSLPPVLDDQSNVYIRWIQTSDERVDGDTENGISSGGTSRIDDIIITGQAITPIRTDVWPGDTNRDEIVDESDVLVLATYWLSEGPPAIYPSIQFEAREVEEWIPAFVTDADANGDGRVDQNDLQPIGLHFDDSVPDPGLSGHSEPPITQLNLRPLEAGETADIFLTTSDPVDITGVSFRFDIVGVEDPSWTVTAIEPVNWGESWRDANKLLQFTRQQEGIFAAALAHKGWTVPKTTSSLMKITIRANSNWESENVIRLLKGSITANGQASELTNAELSATTAVSIDPVIDERPLRTKLLPNYPNPFNPVTSIPFTLSEPGVAQIDVFDAIGRRVAGIQYESRPAGTYTFRFDASALSSGLYLYRLKANGVVQTRKMMLLK